MSRVALLLLRAYVGLFAFFASDREHARREHSLLVGSLRESYAARRAERSGRARAAIVSLWEHLGELSPVALFLKTRADAADATPAEPAGRPWREVAVGAAGITLTLIVAVGVETSSPLLALAAVSPFLALTLLTVSIVATLRRPVSPWIIVLVVALGTWPFWRWQLPLAADVGAVAMFTVTLLVAGVTLRGRISAPGVALLALAPVALQASRTLTPHLLWLRRDLGLSIGEWLALERLAAITTYLLVLTIALWLLSRRSRQATAEART